MSWLVGANRVHVYCSKLIFYPFLYSNLYPWTFGWGSGFFYSMAIGVLNLVYKMLISISAGGWEMDLTFISESIQRKEQLCFVRLRGNRLSNFEWVWVGATDQKFKLIFSFTTKFLLWECLVDKKSKDVKAGYTLKGPFK